jgi:TM2 domain-containing membrane protein YozV
MAFTLNEVETYQLPLYKRTSWGAIFAGFFTGFGVWFLLLALVSAIGLADLNPGNLSSWSSVGKGLGVWSGIAGIVAVFCGAFAAGRLAGTRSGWEGLLHGVTVWAFVLLVTVWMAAMAMAAGAAAAAAAAANAGGAAASDAAPSARQAVEAASSGAWGTFIGAALMLLAGALGGVIGVAGFRSERPLPERTVPTHRPLTPQEA